MSLLDCQHQPHALLRLERARRAGRLGHSMIFHGPEGVGKSLLAKRFARLCCCARPVDRPWPERPADAPEVIRDACDACPECRLDQVTNHPDIIVVNRQTARHATQSRQRQLIDLPIDVIREFVIEPASLRPARNHARIFIIEEAESMNRAAQNALLKTLEEPPANTFIIMITDQPDGFLPTIRSRCQGVRFQALPEVFVAERLRSAGCEGAEATFCADFAQGRLGLALTWAEMGLYATYQELVARLATLGFANLLDNAQWFVDQAKTLGSALLERHPESTAGAATRMAQHRLIACAAHAFRTALRETTAAKPADADRSAAGLGGRFDPWGLAQAIEACREADRRIDANVNAALIFESLMLDYLDETARAVHA